MSKMRPLSWVIIAMNILFLFATFFVLYLAMKSCDGLTSDDSTKCIIDAAPYAGIAVVGLLFFWVFLDVILLILWLVSNNNRRECTKCGRKIKRGLVKCPKCGHEF